MSKQIKKELPFSVEPKTKFTQKKIGNYLSKAKKSTKNSGNFTTSPEISNQPYSKISGCENELQNSRDENTENMKMEKG